MFFEAFGISFSKTFLDGGGCAVYHFFGFFEAKTGEFFNEFYNLKFARAYGFEDYVEGRFFFGFSTGGCGAGCNGYGCGCGFNAVFFFENLSEFVYFREIIQDARREF